MKLFIDGHILHFYVCSVEILISSEKVFSAQDINNSCAVIYFIIFTKKCNKQ
jgi:hypothetical protein